MKTLSLTILAAAAAFSLTGCPGNATNSNNANGTGNNTMRSNANTAAVNSNTNNTASNMNSGANMNSNANMNSGANMTGATTDPSGFMTQAARSDLSEIEMGKLVASKAANAEVKQFAQQMVADHTRTSGEMKPLAAKKNVTLPAEPDAAQKTMMDTLSKLSGAELDREYMRGQVAAHERAVNLFQSQADGGTDAEAKAFAAKHLPALKMHLDMARKINDKLQ